MLFVGLIFVYVLVLRDHSGQCLMPHSVWEGYSLGLLHAEHVLQAMSSPLPFSTLVIRHITGQRE